MGDALSVPFIVSWYNFGADGRAGGWAGVRSRGYQNLKITTTLSRTRARGAPKENGITCKNRLIAS